MVYEGGPDEMGGRGWGASEGAKGGEGAWGRGRGWWRTGAGVVAAG